LGATEFFSGGAKLIPTGGAHGKLRPEEIEIVPEASCLSVTNATEAGTVYTLGELRALGELARAHKLRMHMDGARFANAIATLGCSPAEASWRAGVDILVFGGTKNGTACADLLVVFDPALAAEIAPRYHRSGHRPSKMRFLSAQLEALLTDDLWLRTARRTNALARRLAAGLDGVLHPVEANIVFVRPRNLRALRDAGILFHDWTLFGEGVIRLVAGFGTTEEEVDAVIAKMRG
ncbi:MAG TPA: beta-eliminating lyase-related protein, partial [Thermoanaerobaculia bacterium]|nr:beta-eliminating lyase-related protein [Thermoanaerobaculia bacterium]